MSYCVLCTVYCRVCAVCVELLLVLACAAPGSLPSSTSKLAVAGVYSRCCTGVAWIDAASASAAPTSSSSRVALFHATRSDTTCPTERGGQGR